MEWPEGPSLGLMRAGLPAIGGEGAQEFTLCLACAEKSAQEK